MHGSVYWDETAYYQFSLSQIEDHIEAPTEELHQMCLDIVDQVVRDEELLKRFQIPKDHWDLVSESWNENQQSLYSRLDLAYDGKNPAKLLENNADTPTSLYETGFWQWLWLEDKVNGGELLRESDQFNSLQEKLVHRFYELRLNKPGHTLHLSCCKDTDEDRGTVQYLEDCANEAGIDTKFVFIEDIGEGEDGCFTDLDDQVITWIFKLYPWEFMLREEYSFLIKNSFSQWIEPPWKSILSNKAILPILWHQHPNHPNLLPAFFEDDPNIGKLGSWVKKPIFAREGANIEIHDNGLLIEKSDGPYGNEGYIYQQYSPLPKFGENFTLVGSWLVNDQAAGISIREDSNRITQDLSRYLPHIILG